MHDQFHVPAQLVAAEFARWAVDNTRTGPNKCCDGPDLCNSHLVLRKPDIDLSSPCQQSCRCLHLSPQLPF
jgi:hypothetical protein